MPKKYKLKITSVTYSKSVDKTSAMAAKRAIMAEAAKRGTKNISVSVVSA